MIRLPQVELPGPGVLISDFARRVGRIMSRWMVKSASGLVLHVGAVGERVSAEIFCALAERRMACYARRGRILSCARFNVALADKVLACPAFLDQLSLPRGPWRQGGRTTASLGLAVTHLALDRRVYYVFRLSFSMHYYFNLAAYLALARGFECRPSLPQKLELSGPRRQGFLRFVSDEDERLWASSDSSGWRFVGAPGSIVILDHHAVPGIPF